MNFIENGVKQNSLIFQNAAKGVAFHHAGMMTEERNIGKSPTNGPGRSRPGSNVSRIILDPRLIPDESSL